MVVSLGTATITLPSRPPISNETMFSFSLDTSEHPMEGEDDRKFRFRGILKIANPGWLSDFGIKTVEAELNARAKERAFRLGEGARNPPQLTLENLFGTHLTQSNHSRQKEGERRLTVLVQGERNMPANFMFCTCHRCYCSGARILIVGPSFPRTKWTVMELESSVSVWYDISDGHSLNVYH